MRTNSTYATTPAEAHAQWAKARAVAPHLDPVFRAAALGDLAAFGLTARSTAFPWKMVNKFRLPTVGIIGDDDYSASGPDGWASARAAIGWCAAAIVHAAGAEAAHYAEAVLSAQQIGRLLLIETDSANAPAWLARLTHRPVLLIQSMDGPHPVMPAKGAVH